ncbi:hypothetical protein EJ08DRAFT_646860 [Tothia fuscella]|uniref:Uncharacterized protein n=1 Tax=Tothia fuscella TaxID=1048955 RepID=A0A9P4U2H8_9PEZI|nr:hypothetical protein EJ08DRAFT_646860 [Tothia fuscella]
MMPHENQSKLQRKASPHKASAHNLDASLLVRHNPRKIRARRLDVETSDYRQPIGLPSLATRRSASAEFFPSGQPTLQDLGPFGAHFTTDFDVFPLPMDTYFHDTTLIGSGEFGRAISMVHRSFDVSHGRHIIVHAGRSCAWAQWTDEMATFLHETFGALIARLEDQLPLEEANLDTYAASSVLFLRRIIKANSDTLSFFDPVDRVSCVERFLDVLEPLSAATLERLSSFQALPGKQNLARLLFRALSLQLVLTRQLFAIAQQTISSSTIDSRISSIVLDVSTAVLRYLNDQVFDQVREFLNQNQRRAVREGGIRDEAPAIEAIVMLWHTLKSLDIPGASFWSIINTVCSSGVKDTIKSGTLERKWYNIFTVLPLLEFDNNGLLRAGQRFQEPHDNWEMIRLLLSRVFTLYPATSAIPGSNVNKYMRSLLARCHQLIRGWGWHRCELIIGLIFDFFARNKLAPLQNEVISKSPLFLEILDQHPNLEISLEDSSFHIFLKILGTGLQGMRNIYTEKKITSIAWRCIPNHGRSYRNDEELHPEDLVALRNNHDLLCTLYWASPPKSRPRIDTIHNLVEHSTSQRAACRLNIKAWANLVKFQLSTKEPTETLEPFAVWFNDIVEQTISLYKLAPSEAQEAYEKARKEGNTSLSAGDLMRTVSRNQSNVLASLVDAAVGLRNSLPSASSPINAAYLLEKTNISHIFGLFGLFKPRANPCIIEVLHVYSAFLDLQSKHISSHASRIVNEESQDYGDWPDPEVNAEGANRQPESPEIVPHDFTFGPLAQLLSTCFGAESSPEDALLSTLVDTWTKLALYSVQTKQKDWGIFLDNYSAHSWSSLRATEQTRKYGPYFLAKLAELDKDTLLNNRTHFLSAWLTSLVERDSRLKFQNQLTTTLLKVNSEDVLLQNLPFVAASRDRILAIPLAELRERRLALLSSILSNMRNHFHDTIRNNPHVVQEVRSEYASFLKQMMAAMKTNFHELQQEETIVRGTYVEFVHKLVEFLQEYTSDICPVDPFFTDSNIFPLPANDPKYVVGRLKGYGAKFADPKVMKQLASFLLNVSSRAAIDGEQSYLTEQLTTAMSSTYETGDSARPTLRNMLLQGIFPSYIQASITTPCGWILARPILHACANMFSGFMYDFSATNQGSSDAALQLLSTTLFTLRETISVLSIHPEHLQHSHVLRTVAAIFRVVTSMMPSLDYILRHTKHDTTAVENIVYFKMLTVFVAQTIFGHADTNPPSDPEEQTQIPVTYAEIRNFCHKQLDDLSKTWKRDGDHYYVRLHGSDWKVVEVGIRTIGQERDDVIIAIEEFHTVLGRMKALGNSHS